MFTGCAICGGIGALEEGKWAEHAFIEGFMLGVLMQRISDYTKTGFTSGLCAEHLAELRRLADLIPETLVAPQHRGAILNFGLSVVKGG